MGHHEREFAQRDTRKVKTRMSLQGRLLALSVRDHHASGWSRAGPRPALLAQGVDGDFFSHDKKGATFSCPDEHSAPDVVTRCLFGRSPRPPCEAARSPSTSPATTWS